MSRNDGRSAVPRTLVEFQRRFGCEEAYEACLAELRWPADFVCPWCGGTRAYPIAKRRLRECAACGYHVSTTAGTIVYRTRTDLNAWFLAVVRMITDKRSAGWLTVLQGMPPRSGASHTTRASRSRPVLGHSVLPVVERRWRVRARDDTVKVNDVS